MVLIPIALALIALVAGMTLLAKAQKENLNIFFKIVPYFVVVVSLMMMACICTRTVIHFYTRGPMSAHYGMMDGKGFDGARHDGGRYEGYDGMPSREKMYDGAACMERMECCKRMMKDSGCTGMEKKCCMDKGKEEKEPAKK